MSAERAKVRRPAGTSSYECSECRCRIDERRCLVCEAALFPQRCRVCRKEFERQDRPCEALPPEEVQKRLEEDPGFVAMKKYHYSLEEMIERHPDGCDDYLISKALCITQKQVQAMWARVVVKLRKEMGVGREDLGRG